MGRLQGKVAIISGGARGQGADEAKLFTEEGASVVFGDILEEEGRKLQEEINESGGTAQYIHLNVTKENDWEKAVTKAVSSYGKLDILVNNAGILIMKGLEETESSDWDDIQEVDSKSIYIKI